MCSVPCLCLGSFPVPAAKHEGVGKSKGDGCLIVVSSAFVRFCLRCECSLCGGAAVDPAGMVSLTVSACQQFPGAALISWAWVIM